jgi:5-(carboxyamino)imidazole ribonucleotide synthase
MSPIIPGGPETTIGILGGGQLGRMTAMAARALGYHVQALDPDPHCASRFVVDRCLVAPFDDVAAAEELAQRSSVVTIEIEKIAVGCMEAAARHAPVRPGPEVLRVIQDRGRQKAWLDDRGFPVGPWRLAQSAAELEAAVAAMSGVRFVKSTTGGYDGKGQARISSPGEAAEAFRELGACVVEQGLPLAAELSVMVARRPGGQRAVFPPSQNHHEAGVLDWSVMPAPLDPAVLDRACTIADAIADALDVVGLLAVEFFLVEGGALYVNELAPRPHNSFHATEIACLTSQFEQVVRAICDLPLGSTELVRPTAIANLLGDLWHDGAPPRFDRALEAPGVRLHLYGKRVPRPGRKMGHLSVVGRTAEEAIAGVRAARARMIEATVR